MNRRLRVLSFTLALGIVGMALAACSSSSTTSTTMDATTISGGALLASPTDLGGTVGTTLNNDLLTFERELGSMHKLITDPALLERAPVAAPSEQAKAANQAVEQVYTYHMCSGE